TLTHLGSTAVRKGATLAEGDAVGVVGPSGDAEVEVPYVHLGIRGVDDPDGYRDPVGFLPPRPVAPASQAPVAPATVPQPTLALAAPGPPAASAPDVAQPAAADPAPPLPPAAAPDAAGTTVEASPLAETVAPAAEPAAAALPAP